MKLVTRVLLDALVGMLIIALVTGGLGIMYVGAIWYQTAPEVQGLVALVLLAWFLGWIVRTAGQSESRPTHGKPAPPVLPEDEYERIGREARQSAQRSAAIGKDGAPQPPRRGPTITPGPGY
jgi:hypothetical protein